MKHRWRSLAPEQIEDFQRAFLSWYDKNARVLPWRSNHEAYRVWISEIMLQQTRVETVIGYFNRFMEWFPDVATLAAAPEDKVLKAWEGLGYYSRARNIQAAAKQIMAEYGGEFPRTFQEIQRLKGIGPYTAGAIASIAFGEAVPAVDGNVFRVMSRVFEMEEDIAKASSRKVFDEAVLALISQEHPGDFNQAYMDLGSAICTPTTPNCAACPLARFCQAREAVTQLDYPVKVKKIKQKPVYYLAHAIHNSEGEYKLVKRASTGLLANMWTFPLEEVTLSEYKIYKAENYPEITHIFSHLKWHVLLIEEKEQAVVSEAQATHEIAWVKPADFENYVFPKPQQKLVEKLEK
jgi:A/G-specific adenine glycosylase